ncbi:hypothetical protein F3Y22_tig00111000pilonHSYRG00113 [Hibiscus syriacus]|uniref:CWF21 domain-containing protein n=1 Tax=Hibiscus syriacus TaxID=106335 RepID=A0A6A2Z804_HIBSY|nr:hypothetical protein F3Y22_tig00111000pilonHSYRG00113 [Hibiscus syriacus]
MLMDCELPFFDQETLANQDAALAMGKGAAMRELMDLPLAELERRRHNGLSLVGGREIMVARLLSLEDAEKQRNYELDDELKLRSSSSRHLSGQRDAYTEPESLGLSEWTRYREDEIHSERKVSVPLAETFPVPQPELIPLTKKDKIDPVLPASKWAREDDDSDDEENRSTRLSSGSENADDGLIKADELEFGTDVNTPAPSERAINDEQRQKLRRLDVALIEYRESLEERGIKNAEDIERMVTGGEMGGMMHLTLQESGITVKAKARALLGNNQTERVIEKTVQKRSKKGTGARVGIEVEVMIRKVKGGETGSELIVKRVEAGKGTSMTGIEAERGIGEGE